MRVLVASALLALSAAAAADVTPHQVHLSLAGGSDVRVAWFTLNASASTCTFGASPSSLNNSASGTSVQYLTDGGYHHVVKLAGLLPSSTVFYSCGSAGAASPTASFTTAPAVGTHTPFRSIIYGDHGWLNSSVRAAMLPVGGLVSNWTASPVMELIQSLAPASSLIWVVGDIAYADDSFGHLDELLGFGYEKAYNGYMDSDWMGSVSSYLPVMVSPGNREPIAPSLHRPPWTHPPAPNRARALPQFCSPPPSFLADESECHDPYCVLNEAVGQQLRNFSAYNARWAMPSAESGGVLSMWHSWTFGRVHFVAIDTETCPGCGEEKTGDSHMPWFPAGGFAPAGAYEAWLAADLAAARAARANGTIDFIVAGGHRPFEDFPSGNISALFKANSVDVYYAGKWCRRRRRRRRL